MYLTYKMLKDKGSCDLDKYKETFPDNILVTANSLRVAQHKGFSLRWFSQRFLTRTLFEKYIIGYNDDSPELPFRVYMALGETEEVSKGKTLIIDRCGYSEEDKADSTPIKEGDIVYAFDFSCMPENLRRYMHTNSGGIKNSSSYPFKVVMVHNELMAIVPNDGDLWKENESLRNTKVTLSWDHSRSLRAPNEGFWVPKRLYIKYLKKSKC